MALPKLFERILWHNNTTPAINEDNLNAMSKGLSDVDDRVIELAGTIMEDVPAIQEYLEQADELVDQMEELSTNPPYIGSNGNWYVWDTNTGAYVDSNVDASITVAIADITMLAPTAIPYVTNTGTNTDPIFHLYIPRGIGIASIQKTGTSGLVDTYTITYSDGYTSTFTVTNGKTAYQYAVDGGYSGTEADFYADLANFEDWKDDAEQGASDAEAYAKGTRGGTAVDSSDPAYHNNAQYFAGQADTSAQASAGSATSSAGSASDSEAYGAGTRNGVPVSSSDPAYHNNAPYYAQQAAAQTLGGLSDVDINASTLADGQIIAYDAATEKFKNVTLKTTVIQNVPSQSGTLTYDGTDQSPTWNNYNSNIMTIGGVTTGKNAGTYTATFTPALGYCWDDYSTGAKSVTWTIGKAPGHVTLSKNSVTLDSNTLSDTVTVTATGVASVSSSDTSIATASVSGSTITINSVNNTTGSATITVSIAASSSGNFDATTATISVAAQFRPPLVAWSTGTDQQIKDMIDGYYDGTFSLDEIKSVWSVGDVRTVSFNSMATGYVNEAHDAGNYGLRILNFGGKTLKESINGHTECLIIVGTERCFAPAGYLHNDQTNTGGWRDCRRRSWCNSTFRGAIASSIIKDLFKLHYNISGQGGQNNTGTYQTEDYFALPAQIEVFNTEYDVSSGEGSQFSYFQTEANRKLQKTTDDTYGYYWLRSPVSTSYYQYHVVTNGGTRNKASCLPNSTYAPTQCNSMVFGCM